MAFDALTYRIALAMVRDMGVERARTLLDDIGGDAEKFFSLSEGTLRQLTGSNSVVFTDKYRDALLQKAVAEQAFIAAGHITCRYYTDPSYPVQLLACPDAPVMLYTLGDLDMADKHCLAIVGTRHATAYGVKFVDDLVADLATRVDNLVIVSGLAYGIDIAAHRAALHAGIPTVAVLGHGLNTIYPAMHRATAVEMVRHGGMLLTEYTSRHTTNPGHFLARNRIIAGLCQATVVAESARRGGAMATARLAFEYNRDVLALPGRVTDTFSEGCNLLIQRQTAQVLTCPDDVIRACGWDTRANDGRQKELFNEPTEEERAILRHLSQHPQDNINALAMALGMPVGRLTSMLMDMEFRDLVQSLPGSRYAVL